MGGGFYYFSISPEAREDRFAISHGAVPAERITHKPSYEIRSNFIHQVEDNSSRHFRNDFERETEARKPLYSTKIERTKHALDIEDVDLDWKRGNERSWSQNEGDGYKRTSPRNDFETDFDLERALEIAKKGPSTYVDYFDENLDYEPRMTSKLSRETEVIVFTSAE